MLRLYDEVGVVAGLENSTDELVMYCKELVETGDTAVDGSLLTTRGEVVGVKLGSITNELDVLQGTIVVIVTSRSVVKVL